MLLQECEHNLAEFFIQHPLYLKMIKLRVRNAWTEVQRARQERRSPSQANFQLPDGWEKDLDG